MTAILVVSADSRETGRLRAALSVEGWWVTEVGDRQSALRAVADQAPDLVLVDGEVAGAGDLVRGFCSGNGGPGALLFAAPEQPWASILPPGVEPDAVFTKPVPPDEMIREVRRVLATPRQIAEDLSEAPRRKMTADEIFADVLREVEEADVSEAPPPAAEAPEVALAVDPPPPLPPLAPAPAPPRRRPAAAEPPPAAAEPPPAAAPEAPPEPQAEAERRFGQYVLDERIAVGGMAEVWKARRMGLEGFEKRVAIKKILPHLSESPDFEKMFIEEAKLAARLDHENIVHIYELGKIGDEYFIAMEYVEGRDLRSILNACRRAGQRLPLPLTLLIGARLSSALAYAHERHDGDARRLGLVHRDVSPRNVLVSAEGRVKLCDFGVAKATTQAVRTQIGALKGKLPYMSPEQAWGAQVDARSDIFSLGAVLYEMLTGERLFRGDSEISLLEAVRQCRVRSPRETAPETPARLERVVVRALRKDPRERYQSAADLERDLEALLYASRPTPGSGDLAAFVAGLTAVEPEAAAVEPEPAAVEPEPAAVELEPAAVEPEPAAAFGPGPSAPAAEEPSEVAAAARPAPLFAEPLDDELLEAELPPPTARRRLPRAAILLLSALAVLALGVAGWMLRRDRGEQPEPAAATESAAEDADVPPETPAAVPPETPAAAAPPEAPGTGEPAPPVAAEPPPAVAGPVIVAPETPPPTPLERLVDREMARREAELRRAFDEEEARLRLELESLRAAEESEDAEEESEDADDDGGG